MAHLNPETFMLRAREVCGAENVLWPDPGSAICVRPSTTAQVASLVRSAHEQGCRIRLGTTAEQGEGACVLLDLQRMNQVVQQDPVSSWVFTQTGITPAQLEAHLNLDGFTLRCHFAGHGASPLSTLFSVPVPGFHPGPSIHRLIAVTAVWPDGSTFRSRVSPRQAVGPDSRTFFAREHGGAAVVTEACLAMFSSAVPSGYETLAFSSLSDALDAAVSLTGRGPLKPLEQALEFDRERWLLHLWFWGPAACVAVARDRAAHRIGLPAGGIQAQGEGPAREFWQLRALTDENPRVARPITAGELAQLRPEPGDFVSSFSPGGAILYRVGARQADPVFLGESADPVVRDWLASFHESEKNQ